MLFGLSKFITALVALWIGSGMVVTSINRISRRLHLSSFLVSFFLLGFATSTPEISVGINSILDNTPQVFVGNYIGGSIVILLLIIPVLAILGGQLNLRHQISNRNLALTLSVIGIPILLTLNQKVTQLEALLSLIFYLSILMFLKNERQLQDLIPARKIKFNRTLLFLFLKVIFGILIVFFASDIVVAQTVQVSQFLGLSTFVVSLMVISIGTNLPEFSIALRSVILNKKAVAFGNYLGSASFNTLLMAIMTLYYGSTISINNHASITLSIFLLSLVFFYLFAKSKHTISRSEAFILLGFYLSIITFEVVLNTLKF